jgi:hypothetical protein
MNSSFGNQNHRVSHRGVRKLLTQRNRGIHISAALRRLQIYTTRTSKHVPIKTCPSVLQHHVNHMYITINRRNGSQHCHHATHSTHLLP